MHQQQDAIAEHGQIERETVVCVLMRQSKSPDIIYEVDPDARIISVDDAWDSFAKDNLADHLVTERIVGDSLWDHITGRDLRELYETVLKNVSDSGESIRYPFRCDSPSLRRFLELEISFSERGWKFVSRTLSVEEREPVELLDPSLPRGDEIVTLCSWCKKIKTPKGWLPVEQGLTELRPFDSRQMPAISHGMCDECLDNYMSG